MKYIKVFGLTTLSGLFLVLNSISAESLSNEVKEYIKEQFNSYDRNLGQYLWGSFPGDSKGKINSVITSYTTNLHESYRELNKSFTKFKQDTQSKLKAIDNEHQIFKNKIDLITKHMLNIIEVIKTNKSLAKEYSSREKIGTK